MKFVIFGGGCYGTFYARQLLRARENGALAVDDIIVVDHGDRPKAAELLGDAAPLRILRADWLDFLDTHLAAGASPDEHLVPPPFTPNLAVGWLIRSLQRAFPDACFTTEDFKALPGTPFQSQRENGTLVASHADWLCPVNCIEPARCPATRGPRDWDMGRTVRVLADALDRAGQSVRRLCVFHCHHLAYGVGTYPARALVEARDALRNDVAAEGDLRFLAATVSHCHGAFHLVRVTRGTDSVSGKRTSTDSATLSGSVGNDE